MNTMEVTVDPRAWEAYVSSLESAEDRAHFTGVVAQLNQLAAGPEVATNPNESALQHFLSGFCEGVADLFAANAVAIWFARPQGGLPYRQVDVGWSNFALDHEAQAAHQQLMGAVFASTTAVAVAPFSSFGRNMPPNPTDSWLLLAPGQFDQRTVALLEVVLGPRPLRRPQDALVGSYLSWMQWLSELLERGLQQCFEAEQPLFDAIQCLQQTAHDVEAMQARIVRALQHSLQTLAGQRFGSFAANRRVAKEVHALLDSKGLRVKCPECGAPAILRCQKVGNAKTGAFVYDHYLETGRTFHGGPSSFPSLELVPKPPRRSGESKG